MTDEMEHSASGLYFNASRWEIRTELDGLCQHDKSVEMGMLTTKSRSARAQGFNL